LNRRAVSILIGLVCLIGVVPAALSGPATAASSRAAAVTTKSRAVMTLAAGDTSGIPPSVIQLAIAAVSCAVNSGAIEAPRTLTVIDYSLPSTTERMWVFDVPSGRMLFKELVAHGRNTGENLATSFSDVMNSRQSSLGLFVTRDTYVGSNGYSLRMNGLEPGFNGNAFDRAIVMHGAPYVDAALAKRQGRIGRSWGCPALREAIARDIIDTIRGGGVIFSYYPDQNWLSTSRFLNCGQSASATKNTEV
jgi:hypothetical protein